MLTDCTWSLNCGSFWNQEFGCGYWSCRKYILQVQVMDMHSHHGTGPNLDLPYISCWTNMHSVLIISGTGLCCFLTLYLALLGVCTQDVTENQHAACYSTPVIS